MAKLALAGDSPFNILVQDYVTWPSAAALVLPNLAAALLMLWRGSAPPLKAGWCHVTPGVAFWLGGIGSLLLSSLIAWVWLFVGSSRADGDSQLRVAWWLSMVFGLGSLWSAWRIFVVDRMALRWRGNRIAWNQFGQSIEREITGVTSLSGVLLGDRTRIVFDNGHVLEVDVAAARANELIDIVAEANGLADPDNPPEH